MVLLGILIFDFIFFLWGCTIYLNCQSHSQLEIVFAVCLLGVLLEDPLITFSGCGYVLSSSYCVPSEPAPCQFVASDPGRTAGDLESDNCYSCVLQYFNVLPGDEAVSAHLLTT